MVGAQQGAGEWVGESSPALFWKSGKSALILDKALILSIFVLNFPFKF